MKILKLKNSLTNEIDSIELKHEDKFNMYLCGPTVYDNVHIGNMRPSLIFDIIARLLKEIKVDFKYVQNITDVDDKIIEKALKENKSEKIITKTYTNSYLENFEKLNLIKPEFESVTDNMKEIINFIEKLIENENAYILENNVLFNIKKNENEYGKLSKQILKKLSKEEGRNVNIFEKKDEKDFVLWKNTKEGVNWDTPWFKGRPGWHTECVTLIDTFFQKKTIDIHGGGKDLLFPHHENERIQYFAINKKELSKVWIHFGHVNSKEEKMSKSLGNFITAKDFIEKHGPNTLKIFLLNSRYNEDIEINEKIIEQSKSQIKKIENVLKKINLFFYFNKLKTSNLKNYEKKEEVIEILLNNLEITKVIFILEETISFINREIEKNNNEIDIEILKIKINDFLFILKILGFDFNIKEFESETIKLIESWKHFIKERKFEKSDEVRKLLQEKKIL
ncbi:MAG: Cysteine--tRNA ligase [Mycoplasmataceae bacterium]|nr:MAG: Cysteine--tRNA ligase [Mycoplasmataceae bacterium]